MFKALLRKGLCHAFMKLAIHIFSHAVDPDEHVPFLPPHPDFLDIDVHRANVIRLEFLYRLLANFLSGGQQNTTLRYNGFDQFTHSLTYAKRITRRSAKFIKSPTEIRAC